MSKSKCQNYVYAGSIVRALIGEAVEPKCVGAIGLHRASPLWSQRKSQSDWSLGIGAWDLNALVVRL